MPGVTPCSRWSALPARTTTNSNGGQEIRSGRRPVRDGNGSGSASPQLELSAALSASLKDELLRQIESLGAAEDAALWAQRNLAAKNKLSAADARSVEETFKTRLANIAPEQVTEVPKHAKMSARRPDRGQRRRRAPGVDKTVLALPTTRRVRDREHVKSVAKQPCLICGRRPADAHHLRFAQAPALGRKVSDEFTVPLCRGHHREVHRCGDEAAWWNMAGIDPTVSARALWLSTHPLPHFTDPSAETYLSAAAVVNPGSKLQNEANWKADDNISPNRG